MPHLRRHRATAWEYEKLTDNSAVLPVDLAETKLFMKVTGSSEDALITSLLKDAEDWFERFTNVTLLTTQFKTFRDDFSNFLELRRNPFVSLDSVKFLKDGVLTTFDLANIVTTRTQPYRVIALKENKVFPQSEDLQPSAVEIEFTAGFGATEAAIPIGIKAILKRLTLFYFENRGDCGDDDIPKQIISRAAQFKNVRIHVPLH